MPSFLRSLIAVVFLMLLGTTPSGAQTLGAYEGEVAVASQSEIDRVAALPQALAQVLRKHGGARVGVASLDGAQAEALLQQYRYRQQVVNVDGVAGTQLYLIARFDQARVQEMVGSSGATSAWTLRRPQPILWLAIDDGSGARIVSQSAAAAVTPLTTRAVQRGVTIRLPTYDAQDQATIIARDLSSQEPWSVDTATQRYGGPALIGWMRRSADGWVVDWRLRDAGMELGQWQSRDPQSSVVLASGADGAADVLAQRAAQPAFSGAAGRYRVVIEGLSNAADFARVMSLLKRQPIVRELEPQRLSGARLELDVELTAGVDGLAQLLRGGALTPVSIGDLKTPSEFTLDAR